MVMRTTLQLDHTGPVNWAALAKHDLFLYRRVGDQRRALLGVGLNGAYKSPLFGSDGAAADWMFGYFDYDLKNELEHLAPRLVADPGTLSSFWFEPRFVVDWRDGSVLLHCLPQHEEEGRALVAALHTPPERTSDPVDADWVEHTTREAYLRQATTLLDHIRRGDIYEVNYCTTRTAQLPDWDPYAAFGRLLAKSDAPFAAFHRFGKRFVLCASPERFLAFDGDRVVGQPMKGTRPRSMDLGEDERIAQELANDPKERSENIMALDVMRNDLARIASSGTVKVDELCGVHAFTHVHQMVSTVSARMLPGTTPLDAVAAAFPMASMTGAPKIKAMQLIDAVEDRCRGLFSGSLGFFAPGGTGDLNVVIRTVLYNAETGEASLSTGSALTATCDPEREWDECVLKARSVIEALRHA